MALRFAIAGEKHTRGFATASSSIGRMKSSG
jgi:hypothetical protein